MFVLLAARRPLKGHPRRVVVDEGGKDRLHQGPHRLHQAQGRRPDVHTHLLQALSTYTSASERDTAAGGGSLPGEAHQTDGQQLQLSRHPRGKGTRRRTPCDLRPPAAQLAAAHRVVGGAEHPTSHCRARSRPRILDRRLLQWMRPSAVGRRRQLGPHRVHFAPRRQQTFRQAFLAHSPSPGHEGRPLPVPAHRAPHPRRPHVAARRCAPIRRRLDLRLRARHATSTRHHRPPHQPA